MSIRERYRQALRETPSVGEFYSRRAQRWYEAAEDPTLPELARESALAIAAGFDSLADMANRAARPCVCGCRWLKLDDVARRQIMAEASRQYAARRSLVYVVR